jgi:hypothetical protein
MPIPPASQPSPPALPPRAAPAAWWPVGLVAAAALPFAVGRLAGASVTGGPVLCPFRAATGVPCPLCGATRSVALFAQGDGGFLSYNPVWVVVLLALVAFGVAALATGARRVPRAPAVRAVVLACLAAGWTCSLLHHQAITGA